MVVSSLTEQRLELIPLLYVVSLAPSAICLAVIAGLAPQRRRRRELIAAPA
jgi:hypothetical protein